MRTSVTFRCGGASACAAVLALACSAGSPGSGVGGRSGGASSSDGGGTSSDRGGTSTGSAPGSSAGGGVNIIVTDAGNSDDGCNNLNITLMPVTPTVLLLVDTSSSMFEPRTALWDPLFNALMDPTTGVVKGLQNQVRFGFTSYNSITQPMLDTECPKLKRVDFGLNNYDAIKTSYTNVGVTPIGNFKWETPTGESIVKVTETLKAYAPTPPGPKYILLVTDGNPDTCANRDPQCGEDASIKAVQDAYAAGIGTFVIGIGDILVNNAGCVGRCGKDHLQDIANAGVGLPVAANSTENAYQACTGSPANVKGKYASGDGGEVPGSAPFYTPTGQAELTAALTALLNSVASCTFEMNAKVTGDPSLGTVKVGGTMLTYADPNGWKLEDNHYSVTLQGTACSQFRAGGNDLSITFPCDVAVPR